jgi:hypothetical protein
VKLFFIMLISVNAFCADSPKKVHPQKKDKNYKAWHDQAVRDAVKAQLAKKAAAAKTKK